MVVPVPDFFYLWVRLSLCTQKLCWFRGAVFLVNVVVYVGSVPYHNEYLLSGRAGLSIKEIGKLG